MTKATLIGAVVVGGGCILVARHMLSEDPPATTYELDRFPSHGYTLTLLDPAKARLEYTTPCGKQSLDLNVDATEPDELGVIEVPFPKDRKLPSLAKVRRDPKLVGIVTLGDMTITNDTEVLDPECGATLSIAGTVVELPPLPEPLDDRAVVATLFVTARTEQCFLDQFISYGVGMPSRPHVLEGANAYWLQGNEYDVWFRKIPETMEVTTVRFGDGPVPAGAKIVAALTECGAD